MSDRADCQKCGGAGWVWGHELNDADADTQNDTMTKYSCDECEPPASPPHAAAELRQDACGAYYTLRIEPEPESAYGRMPSPHAAAELPAEVPINPKLGVGDDVERRRLFIEIARENDLIENEEIDMRVFRAIEMAWARATEAATR